VQQILVTDPTCQDGKKSVSILSIKYSYNVTLGTYALVFTMSIRLITLTEIS